MIEQHLNHQPQLIPTYMTRFMHYWCYSSQSKSGSMTRGGYLVFGRIHELDLSFGRPTHPSTKTFCPDPSIYQFVLPIFALELIYLPKFDAQTHPSTIFCQFLLLNPSIYQKFYAQTHPSTKISHFF